MNLKVRPVYWICLLLILTTVGVYGGVRSHEFINLDDTDYVTGNPHVRFGITTHGIVWAFTTFHAANWHPLTWLSHMLDVEFSGLNPGAHHLTNVFFHIVNTLLLFLVFQRMTTNIWRSGFVAALFALHPLHVESVAWVSERKDVLSTFFWMLTLWGYFLYVKRPTTSRYLTVLLFFILGLMAKPMLVTLPFVLLLLDYWPLRRFPLGESSKFCNIMSHRHIAYKMFSEKVPLIMLSTASCVVTYFAQKGSGAISSLERVPLDLRVANALVSYIRYIVKTILPHRLALLYPLPLSIPWWETLGALIILIVTTVFAFRVVKRHPYITVGWIWFLGTLIPVIGLVQVGIQAMADRYTYVPLIGLFIAATWGFHEVLSKFRYGKLATAAVAGCFLVNVMAATWFQVHRWVDSITLFRHALAVTKDNFGLKNNLGDAYLRRGRIQEAIEQFQDAIRIKPDFGLARDNLATALTVKEKFQGNIPTLLKNLESSPNDFMLHFRLGNLYDLDGDLTKAIHHYQKALSIQPEYVPLLNDLGIAYAKTGAYVKSLYVFEKALTFDPDNNETHYTIACIYARQTKPEDAVVWLQKAIQKGYNNWRQIKSDVNLDNIRQDVRFRKIISGL